MANHFFIVDTSVHSTKKAQVIELNQKLELLLSSLNIFITILENNLADEVTKKNSNND